MKRTDIVHRIAETMHRIAPPARTILKYALFYHGNREFTENSEHSRNF